MLAPHPFPLDRALATPWQGTARIWNATATAQFRPEIARRGSTRCQILANWDPASYDPRVRYVSPRLIGALIGVFPLFAACSHQDPADRSVEAMKSDITKMQTDRDRFDERLEALEAAEQRRDDADRHPRPPRTELVPKLPVVRVGETDGGPPLAPTEGEAADIGSEIDGPRPVVEAQGPGGASRGRGRSNPGLSPEAN